VKERNHLRPSPENDAWDEAEIERETDLLIADFVPLTGFVFLA
jgi:hypothetical protein